MDQPLLPQVWLTLRLHILWKQSLTSSTAIAANGILRYILGAVFPLFTIQMFQNLGVHWAASLFAFVALGLLLIPWLLYKYGPVLRSRSKFNQTASK